MSVSPTRPQRPALAAGEGFGSIVRVEDALRDEAVGRLIGGAEGDAAHRRRFFDFARRSGMDLRGMWASVDEAGRVVASVLAVPNAGRTAMVFATTPQRDGEIDVLARLIDHACREMTGLPGPLAEVNLAQGLTEPGAPAEREAFARGGFRHLADLSYLERPLPGPKIPRDEPWPAGVRVEPYHEGARAVMLEVLEASYEDTLDCPGLVGLRPREDILAGHMGSGEYDAALWTLLFVDGRPAGALLLNPSSQGRCVELVYLGLAAFARGRGLGRRLLRHGLCLLRGRRERLLMLAVDERNAPALALYRGEGFRRAMRRIAMIRPIGRGFLAISTAH